MDGRAIQPRKQQTERAPRAPTLRIAIAAVAALYVAGPVEAFAQHTVTTQTFVQPFPHNFPAQTVLQNGGAQSLQKGSVTNRSTWISNTHTDMYDPAPTNSPQSVMRGALTTTTGTNLDPNRTVAITPKGRQSGTSTLSGSESWWGGSADDSRQVTYKRQSVQARHKKRKYE
jgi:hypothetical protein